MKAMILKEFRQMRRDRRTLVLMIGMPLMLLVVFGYAARFDVTEISTAVVGPNADDVAGSLPGAFSVESVDSSKGVEAAHDLLRDSKVRVVLVTDTRGSELLIDGTELFVAQSALRRVPPGIKPEILFNPDLDTATVMVPSLIGYIMLFVGTVITSLGVVREREQGTLEQLAIMPLRPIDVTVGKIAPYFLVSLVDMIAVTVAGLWLFDVPFVGSVLMFGVFGLLFLFVVLGLGLAISTVSKSQGEAIQLAIMTLVPQIMLSGMIFPLESMATGVRWLGWFMPLTWFVIGMRGIMLKGSHVSVLLFPAGVLALMALVVFGVALVRFRKDLAPKLSDRPTNNELAGSLVQP